MSEANCFIMLDPERTSVDIGEQVEVQPFQNLI
jgi:molybdopterin biosynthesis enzyme